MTEGTLLRALLAAMLLFAPQVTLAQIPVPPLKSRVTDLTGTLNSGQRAALEQKLAAFEAKKGSQIAVLAVPTTQPETIEQYSIRVAEQWKLGRKGVDDGVLLLVAMKDRAVVANSGHFDVEIDIAALQKMAKKTRITRENVREFVLPNGKKVFLIAEGRLVNLGAAEGHPAMVMDMSFANQALGAEWVAQHYKSLDRKVYRVPQEIDREISRLKLQSMGVAIDKLTKDQEKYLSGWEAGT